MNRFLMVLMILYSIGIKNYACSAFVLKANDKIILGKNFDWTFGEGILIKNLRGIEKYAYFTHDGIVAHWTSKYGSVTFNQNGKEMPYGGMNEMGLAIEMLWLETTQYNIDEAKNYVNELEWIQFQLDNYSSINQVVDNLDNIKIYPIKGKVHYILADRSGESVVIEYLNGKALVYRSKKEFCQVITNNSVDYSNQYKNSMESKKNNTSLPLYRYYLLDQSLKNNISQSNCNEDFAFNLLSSVSIPKGDFKTRWSIVYNIHSNSISFFSNTNKKIKSINLSDLNFAEILAYFNINQDDNILLNGKLLSFTETENQKFVSNSLIHLGFDKALTLDLGYHQFQFNKITSSYFSDNYFHFEISIPLDEEKQTGFLAIMENEENFQKRKVVPGGYLYGSAGKGTISMNIYGLKNGQYAMLAFIDNNKNRKLDFDKNGTALEKYSTFGKKVFSKESELNFSNTSAYFTKANAKFRIQWS